MAKDLWQRGRSGDLRRLLSENFLSTDVSRGVSTKAGEKPKGKTGQLAHSWFENRIRQYYLKFVCRRTSVCMQTKVVSRESFFDKLSENFSWRDSENRNMVFASGGGGGGTIPPMVFPAQKNRGSDRVKSQLVIEHRLLYTFSGIPEILSSKIFYFFSPYICLWNSFTAEMCFSKACIKFGRCYGNQGWAQAVEKYFFALEVSLFNLSERSKTVAEGVREIFEEVYLGGGGGHCAPPPPWLG